MEIIGKSIERLLDDLKRVTALLEDATLDIGLMAFEPYQEARLSALRRELSVIKEQLKQLRTTLAISQPPSTGGVNASFLELEKHRGN